MKALDASLRAPPTENLSDAVVGHGSLGAEPQRVGALRPRDLLVLCDEKGKERTSAEFARELRAWLDSSPSAVVFAVGGAFGLDPDLLIGLADVDPRRDCRASRAASIGQSERAAKSFIDKSIHLAEQREERWRAGAPWTAPWS